MRFRYPCPKPDESTGYRRPRPRYDWPEWYTIDRVKPGELLGSLHAERVNCGKENCRCQSGAAEDQHGPYWYRRWREGDDGRQRKEYVKQGDLPEVRARIEHRRRRLAEEREARKKHMRRGEYARGSIQASYSGYAAEVRQLGRILDRLISSL